VLKNITFSGKGLVRNPANPGSVILPFGSTATSGRGQICELRDDLGYSLDEGKKQTEKQMAEANELQRIAELTAKADAAEKRAKDAEAALADQKSKDLEAKLSVANDALTKATEKATAFEAEKNTLATQLAEAKAAAEKAQVELNGFKQEKAAAEAEKRLADRIAKVTATYEPDAEKAKTVVATLTSLNDEAFAAHIETMKTKLDEARAKAATPAVDVTKVAAQAVATTPAPAPTPVPTPTNDGAKKVHSDIAGYLTAKASKTKTKNTTSK